MRKEKQEVEITEPVQLGLFKKFKKVTRAIILSVLL